MRAYLGTKTLLSGLQDTPGHVTAGEPCKGPLCMPHLCTPPLIPHTVYAAVSQASTYIYITYCMCKLKQFINVLF